MKDTTQTNHTLDSSPDTFPLDRRFYADFTHDDQMTAIYSAMGLFKIDSPLDPTRKQREDGGWILREMISFSAKMVVERLSCDAEVGLGGGEGEYVRVLVNDRVMPLDFCGAKDGICDLERFIKSQGYARSGGAGDWGTCFE